ncbi:MAG TPA: alpha/beta fold hydrolase, partial [Mycobacterium sp.]|nr:alpha/beta fold hydrolase [Mycobacterium sp.]
MRPSLLFVHSPVTGPSTWTGVADALRRRGFRCALPDLRSALAQGPPFYPRLAAAAASTVTGGGAVVLVGHSAAGPLLPVIGEAVAAPVRGVFVDAQLPHPGRSWFDAAPVVLRDQLLAMAEPRVPVAYFEEVAPVTRRLGKRWAYLRFSAGFDDAADDAERRGWRVERRDW